MLALDFNGYYTAYSINDYTHITKDCNWYLLGRVTAMHNKLPELRIGDSDALSYRNAMYAL